MEIDDNRNVDANNNGHATAGIISRVRSGIEEDSFRSELPLTRFHSAVGAGYKFRSGTFTVELILLESRL